MSLFRSKSRAKSMIVSGSLNDNNESGLVTFKNHLNGKYLSIDKFGSVSIVKICKNQIGNNETLALVKKEDNRKGINDGEDNIYYIRSYYGHYLTFDLSDNKLYCQKVSYSMTSWRKHTSHLYSKFTTDDLYYFTPSSTAGIIGATGISIYGNKFLCTDNNGTVSNKVIPGKGEMWIISYLKRNDINNSSSNSPINQISNTFPSKSPQSRSTSPPISMLKS